MVLRGGAVGLTLLALGESLLSAGAVAVLFVAFDATGHAVQYAAGDYADNAVLGAVVLVGTGYLATRGLPLPLAAVGGLVGGWLLVDGVQHLRHGVTRDEVAVPSTHAGGLLTGVVKAVGERVLEPFRL
jgi:hypothetical protein